jgi:DNA uptake protein ComE-like DNA-binding protein
MENVTGSGGQSDETMTGAANNVNLSSSPDGDGIDPQDSRSPADAGSALFSIVIGLGILLLWMGYGMISRPSKNQFSTTFSTSVTSTTIDPNTASWASLVRIPDIGPARAEKLIAWRKAHESPDSPIVFHDLSDLRHVPSFGPKTVADIAKYLRFPATPH